MAKAGPHDLTFEVDLQCESRIIRTIQNMFPDHGQIAEERGSHKADADFVWIIDPLDGSVNFYHGIAHFCVSIALLSAQRKGQRPDPHKDRGTQPATIWRQNLRHLHQAETGENVTQLSFRLIGGGLIFDTPLILKDIG